VASALSPSLCNISDTYIRHIEKQYDYAEQILTSPSASFMVKDKSDAEVKRILRWGFYLEQLAYVWVNKTPKDDAKEDALEEAKEEYRMLHFGETPPDMEEPPHPYETPEMRVRMQDIRNEHKYMTRTSSIDFHRAGSIRRSRSNVAASQSSEAIKHREEGRERKKARHLKKKGKDIVDDEAEKLRKWNEKVLQIQKIRKEAMQAQARNCEESDEVKRAQRRGAIVPTRTTDGLFNQFNYGQLDNDKTACWLEPSIGDGQHDQEDASRSLIQTTPTIASPSLSHRCP
jgi:hypothetical protein